MSTLISIIVPVYNAEKYIEEAILSCCKQDYDNCEIIIINDGSTDSSLQICHALSKQFSNIKLINQENRGVNAARLRGLHEASGDYVAFVDSDDALKTEYLSILYGNLKRSGSDISICDHINLNDTQMNDFINPESTGNGENVESISSSEAMRRMLCETGYQSALWGKLFKRKALMDVEFPRLMMGEDMVVNAQLLCRSKKVIVDSRKLYLYRVNPNSLTNRSFSRNQYDYIEAYTKLEKIVSSQFPSLIKYAKRRFARYSVGYLYRALKSGFMGKMELKKMQSTLRERLGELWKSKYPFKFKIFGLYLSLKQL